MKRLTTNKEAREMTGIELAHNCMYSYDGWARFRSFDRDDDLFDFIREFAKAENEGLPADNEVAADMLMDGLQYGIDNPFGRVALVYNLMWAMADVREALKAYENTGLTPEEIVDGKMLTGWIPVEEKLPEFDGLYLVCLDDGYISSVEYMTGRSGKRDWDLWSDNGEVIAWMPLPEPYRPEAEAKLTEMEGSHE